jgi:post-segregation antitoxin (ccd killing protein)
MTYNMKKEIILRVRVEKKIAARARDYGLNASEYQRIAIAEKLAKDRKQAAAR